MCGQRRNTLEPRIRLSSWGMTPIIPRLLIASDQELRYLRSWLELLHAAWLQDTRKSTEKTPRSTQEHPEDSQEAPRSTQKAPRRHPGAPKSHPGRTQEHPGGSQEAPRGHPGSTQEHPGDTQEAPRSTQEAPEKHPGGAQAQTRQNSTIYPDQKSLSKRRKQKTTILIRFLQ